MKILTLAQIKARLPVFKASNSSVINTGVARRLYGKSTMPLTKPLLEKLIGRCVYAVRLQSTPKSESQRLSWVFKMDVLDPVKEQKNWKQKLGKKYWPVKSKSRKSLVYHLPNERLFGEGSGCDLIWVFVA